MDTINITPTWRVAVSICLAALENGTPEGKKLAKNELYRLADLMDTLVATKRLEYKD